MKASAILVIGPLICAGCTSIALERYAVNQTATLTDLRFQQIMNNLAATAANSGVLPSYAPIGEGAAALQDTFVLDPKSLWQRMTFKGFDSETVTLTGERQPQPYWTLDPSSEAQQLEVMHYAFLWALSESAPPPCSDAEKLLKLFQVYDALSRLPRGWLHCSECKDHSARVLYRGRSGSTKLWVAEDGMEGLSAFTLIIQDIATVDMKSLNRKPAAGTVRIQPKDKNANPSSTVQANVESVNPETRKNLCGDSEPVKDSRKVSIVVPAYFFPGQPDKCRIFLKIGDDFTVTEIGPFETLFAVASHFFKKTTAEVRSNLITPNLSKDFEPASQGIQINSTVNPRQNPRNQQK
jgi:hypothetical protein